MGRALVIGWALAAAASFSSAAVADPTFPVREPERPLVLKLASVPVPRWGQAGPMRLVYYVTDGQPFRDEDRRTILRELRLIRDFYAHYGLDIVYEDRVHEVRGPVPADLPAEQHGYYFIKDHLQARGLLAPRRTIVFTTFDVGLGADMALTGLNDSTTRRLECPRPKKGYAWWCGRPESSHWGGSVHEVGHMLGLSHPREFDADHPYRYFDARDSYVYAVGDERRTVMGRHDLFFRHADVGLMPHEIDALRAKYGARLPRMGPAKRP